MKESTRKIIKLHGWRLDRALHNYVYFTYYDRYVTTFLAAGNLLVKVFDRLGLSAWPFKPVFERYHAKVVTTEDMSKILSLHEDVVIEPGPAERILPFHHANKVIFEEPEHIAVMDCPCRLARENHCEPVNVCIAVGKTTADFWMEHGEKFHARRINQDEALDIIKKGRERGEITTAWFKVATGGRTGVICTCCTCCCGALEGMRLAQGLKGGESLTNIVPSGYVPTWDEEKCVSCGGCVEACFFDAITEGPDAMPVFDPEKCVGCGICVEACPQGARELVADPERGVPLDLDALRGL